MYDRDVIDVVKTFRDYGFNITKLKAVRCREYIVAQVGDRELRIEYGIKCMPFHGVSYRYEQHGGDFARYIVACNMSINGAKEFREVLKVIHEFMDRECACLD